MKWTTLRFVALLGFPLMISAFPLSIPAQAQAEDTCTQTAKALRRAARSEAFGAFWVRVASCLNDTDCHRMDCIRDAWSELQEELELIRSQHDERLALCADLGGAAYDPELRPEDFSDQVSNLFFPLQPGRTLVYESLGQDGLERIEFTALPETREIAGIPCRVVHDVVWINGEVIEDTIDWYSESRGGDVWYLGEIAQNFEDGLLDNLDGSWRTGHQDARPGIIMLATPGLNQVYRQEFLPGEAEDVARVVSFGETVTVPAGTFCDCLKTDEWSPLEPNVHKFKYYAPGVGMVLELDPATGERVELVQIVN